MNNFSKSYKLNFLCMLFKNIKMESRKKFSMCRLCLCENECFVNIFQLNDWQDYIAAEAISVLLQFQVSETDGYPHVVCSTCLAKLTEFMLFKESCQKSKVVYDEMFVSSECLEEHKPELDIVEGGCGLELSEQDPLRGATSDPIINQEELDIDCNSVGVTKDPFEGINTEVSFAPILLKHEVMQFNQDNHSQVQQEHVDTVTHIKYLQRLEQTAPNCTSIALVDANSCTGTISTYDESTHEKSKSTSISVGFETLSSVTMEGSEGAFTPSGERIYMANLSELDKEKENGEEHTEGEGQGERGTRPENREREEIYKCYHCGKQLKTKISLIKHMKVHGFGDSHDCDICGKIFKFNSALQTHLKCHTGTKPFKCAVCSKTFSRNVHLVCHMRIHTGSKPYKCPECGKCFRENSSLKSHMRTHTGSKPHKCAECGKCFNTICSLKSHMRIHTGTKPYKCSVCSKCFIQSSHLKCHMRTHTGSKPYKCAECGKCFTTSCNLKSHMSTHRC